MVYPVDNPPSYVAAYKMGRGEKSDWYEPIDLEIIPAQKSEIEIIDDAKKELGDIGVVGLNVVILGIGSPDEIYQYYDDYKTVKENALAIEAWVEEYTRKVIAVKPDFVFIGYSGGLTFQTPEMFRDLALPSLQNTSEVMLSGTPETVWEASRKAIDDAAYGGGFILSTGDQCGRDTPDDNIRAMIDVARTYGKY